MNPILLDIPEHFETGRLLVRAPRPGDGPTVYEAVSASLPELRAWPASLPWAQVEPSPDESEAFCRAGHSAFLARKDFPMLVFRKNDGALVGSTGLHRLNWAVPKGEVGYWGHSAYRGQGYVSEAVKGVCQVALGRLGLRRIECLSDAENTRSRMVAERVGFVLEGVMRHERKDPDGGMRNTCLYAWVA